MKKACVLKDIFKSPSVEREAQLKSDIVDSCLSFLIYLLGLFLLSVLYLILNRSKSYFYVTI